MRNVFIDVEPSLIDALKQAPQERRRTSDPLFLAITRSATVYGVPIVGFVFAVCGGGFVYILTTNYSLVWRVLMVGPAVLVILGLMRALTSYEPHWWSIGVVWARTRLPVLLSRHTRRWGGTTMSPLPVELRRNRAELRDYAG
jgi:type IV secretory pathway VirB3-like protein